MAILGLEEQAGRALARAHGVIGAAIATAVSTGDATISGVVAGLHYLVTSDVDCWLKIGGAATANKDTYLPAKVPWVLMFAREQAADPAVHVIAGGAGYIYLTPMTAG
jgi:hypothetical protein